MFFNLLPYASDNNVATNVEDVKDNANWINPFLEQSREEIDKCYRKRL